MELTNVFKKLGGLMGLGSSAPGTRAKGLILVADDDASLRIMVNRSLTASGYAVIQAEDGERAVQLCRERRPDIVLLDIFMPKKDGLKVLEELADEMPDTGFLVLTGNEDEEVARACLKMGAFDYISKPFDPETLKTIIRDHLQRQAS